jgi:hypothetical protein
MNSLVILLTGSPPFLLFKERLQRLRPLRDFLRREFPAGVHSIFYGMECSLLGVAGDVSTCRERPSNRLLNLRGGDICYQTINPFWNYVQCSDYRSFRLTLGKLSTESSKFLGISVRDEESFITPRQIINTRLIQKV